VGKLTVPFFGEHQAGIETALQAHATFISFSLKESVDRPLFARLMRMWTSDMQLLSEGKPAMGDAAPEIASTPASLTFTLGFGYSLFEKLGLTHRWPLKMTHIPLYSIDRLESQWCDGDVVVQVCANDSLTLTHAVREIVRGSKPFLTPRWMQQGFNPHAGVNAGRTSRNIMGQVDGSGNPKLHSANFSETVWVKESSEDWFIGGTTLVLRRIRMAMDTWETLPPEIQERVIGRKRSNGAPLTGKIESDIPDLLAVKDGQPVIPTDAHIRRATTPRNIFRRIYNYDAGILADGTQDVGLLFATYQADVSQFTDIQEKLAAMDQLNRWTTPVGSGMWVIPKGLQPGEWFASTLLS
jgi:dye decolorizing peroxidase